MAGWPTGQSVVFVKKGLQSWTKYLEQNREIP